jgi:Cd2+/Zn2+-exporting ATPase
VTDIFVENNFSEAGALAIAGAIESKSEHPIAEAIVRKAKETRVALYQNLSDFEAIAGMGVKAKINGHAYLVGSRRFLEAHGVIFASAQNETVSRLENEGKTVVLLGNKQKLLGIFAVADKLRAEAKETVQELKQLGLKVVMLTGDNERTAAAIASQVGVDDFRAQLLPENKVEAVKSLQAQFGKVAMVGDGINDAPAMAVSDVGIAMGAAGTDIAVETGDVVLMSDDLSKIPFALKLSRKAISNMRQNTAASLAIVAFLIPTALIGWLGLLPGLLLNEVSALIVIANALRLLR